MGDPTRGNTIQTKLQENVAQMVNMGTTYAREIGNFAVNFVGSFMNFITQLSIVLTLSVLFSAQKKSVMKFIASLW